MTDTGGQQRISQQAHAVDLDEDGGVTDVGNLIHGGNYGNRTDKRQRIGCCSHNTGRDDPGPRSQIAPDAPGIVGVFLTVMVSQEFFLAQNLAVD